MKSIKLLGLVAIVSQTCASPTEKLLGDRAPASGIHLVDCQPRDTSEGSEAKSWLSLVIYCEDNSECNNIDYVPQTRDICVKRTSNSSLDYHKWENSDWQHCYFAERGVFSWVIG
ncbi:hypothetical protein OQA88_13149, partial [Cercophora sp. LCS_1]